LAALAVLAIVAARSPRLLKPPAVGIPDPAIQVDSSLPPQTRDSPDIEQLPWSAVRSARIKGEGAFITNCLCDQQGEVGYGDV
jgi:hypothetical protein